MLIDQCKLQAGHNVLIWGAAGGLGVFATQLCKAAGANAVGVVSSDEKGELKLANVDGRKLLTVKDPQGKLLFSGPVETKEDLDKMPADVRQRYDRLQQSDLPTAAPRSDTDNADEADTDDADDQDDDDDEETSESVSQQVSFQSSPREMIPQSISF